MEDCGCPPNHRGFGFNGVWRCLPHRVWAEWGCHQWPGCAVHGSVRCGCDCSSSGLIRPRVTDGFKETGENCVTIPRWIGREPANATFYHVHQLSQAVLEPHECTRSWGSTHKSDSHPGDAACWHWCSSSAAPPCFRWPLNTVALTPSAIISLHKFRQTLVFLWGWIWNHCVKPQTSSLICELSHSLLQQRPFNYLHPLKDPSASAVNMADAEGVINIQAYWRKCPDKMAVWF